MVSGRRIELRFETFFEKKKGLLLVFVKKDFCESQGFFRVKIERDWFDSHPLTPKMPDQVLLVLEIRETR